MLCTFTQRSRSGAPVWLPEVRAAFSRQAGCARLVLRLRSFDGVTRDWPLPLPRWRDDAQRAFVRDYLCASLYNAMSVCGGQSVRFFCDPRETELMALLAELPARFQLDAPTRGGLGKVVSIAGRMCRSLSADAFSFSVADLNGYVPAPPLPPETSAGLAPRLRRLCAKAERCCCVGIDVGGTDIKLAAAAHGRLLALKEYDWNPSAFSRAAQITGPILLLARLMRAVIASGGKGPALTRALARDASDGEIAAAVAAAEARLDVAVLDAVGLSFPDIVVRNRIVGGETPKTDGIRKNRAVDYEAEFASLGALRDGLAALCRGGGRVGVINDGSMAAFTAAVELACGSTPEAVDRGVIAHSLGTDLGTGWLDARGRVPPLPLELYDLWLDLGSADGAAFPPEDLRSTRNENSGLPGVRRCLGQSGAFRLAWKADPRLLDGFTEEADGVLRIRLSPEDLRKPCLAHLMRLADEGDAAAESVFREIGRNLAVVSREFDFLLRPAARSRYLFGRYVKSERVFALLREGFDAGATGLRLVNGGEGFAETALMRDLAAREGAAAQFAQAVGAIYYSVWEDDDDEAQ